MAVNRRMFLAGALSLGACAGTRGSEGAPGDASTRRASEALHALCAGLGAGNRLGVMILDTGSGRRIGYRQDERFAMCSTFKAPLAGFVLHELDAGRLRLDEELAFGEADMVANSPVTRAAVVAGRLPVGRLAQAIVEVSDNTGANLLLRRTGGPEAFTAFLRAGGDAVTRLDRWETALNENAPGDPRDTTSPAAMAQTLAALLLSERLSAASRGLLTGWLEACATGRERLRAGLPAGWRVGDKTGTGARGSHNDIAIAWPPGRGGAGRAPIIITSYIDAPTAPAASLNAVHQAVARIAVEAIGSAAN